MKETFYISTPIYYPSDKLHIGHAYCTVAADVMARYKRQYGMDVVFVTGTDEHGLKIEEKAKAAGVTPKAYVDGIVADIYKLWELMDISYDRYVRTTDDYHEQTVQRAFKILFDNGDIYKGGYKGKYCVPCESFWTETQLVAGKCPDCGRDVIDAEEEAYFFKLSKYADRLVEFYKNNPNFVYPPSALTEMINNFIKPGLEDLCVTRTSFNWGVSVDFDPEHVIYVWIDALFSYISSLGYLNDKNTGFDKFWPGDVHLAGREINRFHTIIWPAVLMALDLPLPSKVFVHGLLLMDGNKMSKSRGNVIDPVILANRYGADALRYFLLREFPFGSDGTFSNELLATRINTDLSNDLGNLVSRTLTMCEKYFGAELPTERVTADIDNELVEMMKTVKDKYEANMEEQHFQSALVDVMAVVARANKYIDETTPWILGKNPEDHPRLACVLFNLLEVIRISAILLTPFMPSSCDRILRDLGVDWLSQLHEFAMYRTQSRYNIHRGENLFPRIDIEKEIAELEAMTAPVEAKTEKKVEAPKEEKPKEKQEETQGIITIADFAKVSLRVAKIVTCEPVKKSDKLLQLQLDDGMEGGRQVVSGIAPWYTPEELIGKKVCVVANLQPAKLRGVVSEGMILAADSVKEDGSPDVKVIFIDDAVPVGSVVR